MALSPDDIVNHEFKQSLRGYAVVEVDELLDQLADQVERADREIDELRQRLRENEARLASALETESSIKRTLVTAQDAAERALQEAREQADELRAACEREVTEQLDRAHQEAESLVADAQQRAAEQIEAARVRRDALLARTEELRAIEQAHRDRLREHLHGQLAALDGLDPVPDSPRVDADEGRDGDGHPPQPDADGSTGAIHAVTWHDGSTTPYDVPEQDESEHDRGLSRADESGRRDEPEDLGSPGHDDSREAREPTTEGGQEPATGLGEWLNALEDPHPDDDRTAARDLAESPDRWFAKPIEEPPSWERPGDAQQSADDRDHEDGPDRDDDAGGGAPDPHPAP